MGKKNKKQKYLKYQHTARVALDKLLNKAKLTLEAFNMLERISRQREITFAQRMMLSKMEQQYLGFQRPEPRDPLMDSFLVEVEAIRREAQNGHAPESASLRDPGLPLEDSGLIKSESVDSAKTAK